MYFKKMMGEKVFLSPISAQDAEKFTEWVNDMEAGLGVTFAAACIGLEQESEVLQRMAQSGWNFSIVARDSNQLIGSLGIVSQDELNRWCSVGIFIGDKHYWNNGYGTEAMSLLCDYCLNVLNYHTVRLDVYSYNLPAISCYEKVGFRECGRYHEAKRLAGQWFDVILMELKEEDFKSVYIGELLKRRLQGKV